MIKDLTSKNTRKNNTFVQINICAPDGRFGQDWQKGGISYKSAIFQAKRTPELLTIIVDEKGLPQ